MTGRTRDPILASCARELWLEAAKNGDRIAIEHKPGTMIPLADALSRMAENTDKAAYVHEYIAKNNLVLVTPVTDDCHFFDANL